MSWRLTSESTYIFPCRYLSSFSTHLFEQFLCQLNHHRKGFAVLFQHLFVNVCNRFILNNMQSISTIKCVYKYNYVYVHATLKLKGF